MRSGHADRNKDVLRIETWQGAVEHGGIAAEAAVPELVAEDDGIGQPRRRRCALRAGGRRWLRCSVGISEVAAGHDSMAHEPEEIGADDSDARTLERAIVARHGATEGLECREVFERSAALILDIDVVH